MKAIFEPTAEVDGIPEIINTCENKADYRPKIDITLLLILFIIILIIVMSFVLSDSCLFFIYLIAIFDISHLRYLRFTDHSR